MRNSNEVFTTKQLKAQNEKIIALAIRQETAVSIRDANRNVTLKIQSETMSLSNAYKGLRIANSSIQAYISKSGKKFNSDLYQKIFLQGELKILTSSFDVIDKNRTHWTAAQIKGAFYRCVGLMNVRSEKAINKYLSV